jgi:hypothetical protein
VEEKAAQTLSIAGFPWRQHFKAEHFQHPNRNGQAPLAKVLRQYNSAKRGIHSLTTVQLFSGTAVCPLETHRNIPPPGTQP